MYKLVGKKSRPNARKFFKRGDRDTELKLKITESGLQGEIALLTPRAESLRTCISVDDFLNFVRTLLTWRLITE